MYDSKRIVPGPSPSELRFEPSKRANPTVGPEKRSEVAAPNQGPVQKLEAGQSLQILQQLRSRWQGLTGSSRHDVAFLAERNQAVKESMRDDFSFGQLQQLRELSRSKTSAAGSTQESENRPQKKSQQVQSQTPEQLQSQPQAQVLKSEPALVGTPGPVKLKSKLPARSGKAGSGAPQLENGKSGQGLDSTRRTADAKVIRSRTLYSESQPAVTGRLRNTATPKNHGLRSTAQAYQTVRPLPAKTTEKSPNEVRFSAVDQKRSTVRVGQAPLQPARSGHDKQPIKVKERQLPGQPPKTEPIKVEERKLPGQPPKSEPIKVEERKLPGQPPKTEPIKVEERKLPGQPPKTEPIKVEERKLPGQPPKSEPIKVEERKLPGQPPKTEPIKVEERKLPGQPPKSEPIKVEERKLPGQPPKSEPIKGEERKLPGQPPKTEPIKVEERKLPGQPPKSEPIKVEERKLPGQPPKTEPIKVEERKLPGQPPKTEPIKVEERKLPGQPPKTEPIKVEERKLPGQPPKTEPIKVEERKLPGQPPKIEPIKVEERKLPGQPPKSEPIKVEERKLPGQPPKSEPIKVEERKLPGQPPKTEPIKVEERKLPGQPPKTEPIKVEERKLPGQPPKTEPIKVEERKLPGQPPKTEPIKVEERKLPGQPPKTEPIKVEERKLPGQPPKSEPIKVEERKLPGQPPKSEPIKVEERKLPGQPPKSEPIKVEERKLPGQPPKTEPIKVEERKASKIAEAQKPVVEPPKPTGVSVNVEREPRNPVVESQNPTGVPNSGPVAKGPEPKGPVAQSQTPTGVAPSSGPVAKGPEPKGPVAQSQTPTGVASSSGPVAKGPEPKGPVAQSQGPTGVVANSGPEPKGPVAQSQTPTGVSPSSGPVAKGPEPKGPVAQSQGPTGVVANSGPVAMGPEPKGPVAQSQGPTGVVANSGPVAKGPEPKNPVVQSQSPTGAGSDAGVQNQAAGISVRAGSVPPSSDGTGTMVVAPLNRGPESAANISTPEPSGKSAESTATRVEVVPAGADSSQPSTVAAFTESATPGERIRARRARQSERSMTKGSSQAEVVKQAAEAKQDSGLAAPSEPAALASLNPSAVETSAIADGAVTASSQESRQSQEGSAKSVALKGSGGPARGPGKKAAQALQQLKEVAVSPPRDLTKSIETARSGPTWLTEAFSSVGYSEQNRSTLLANVSVVASTASLSRSNQATSVQTAPERPLGPDRLENYPSWLDHTGKIDRSAWVDTPKIGESTVQYLDRLKGQNQQAGQTDRGLKDGRQEPTTRLSTGVAVPSSQLAGSTPTKAEGETKQAPAKTELDSAKVDGQPWLEAGFMPATRATKGGKIEEISSDFLQASPRARSESTAYTPSKGTTSFSETTASKPEERESHQHHRGEEVLEAAAHTGLLSFQASQLQDKQSAATTRSPQPTAKSDSSSIGIEDSGQKRGQQGRGDGQQGRGDQREQKGQEQFSKSGKAQLGPASSPLLVQASVTVELQRLDIYRRAKTEEALKIGLHQSTQIDGKKSQDLAYRHAPHTIPTLLKKAYRTDLIDSLDEQEVINCFGLILKMGGEFTYAHTARVLDLSMDLADEMGIKDQQTRREIRGGAIFKDIGETALELENLPASKKQQIEKVFDSDDIRKAGLLHDIGKVKVPPEILYKPGKLTEEEFAIMKRHPIYGEEMIYPISSLRHLCPVIRGHHERWDGKGYPDGLSKESIPLAARVIAVADVFDALHAERPYKPAMPVEKVRAILDEGAGSHFDPDVVAAFHRVLDRRYPQLHNPFA